MDNHAPTTLNLGQAARVEARALLDWWARHAPELEGDGFYGEVGNDNQAVITDKSVILNTRLLWFFSQAALHIDYDLAAPLAKRAYEVLIKTFTDAQYGGLFWSLNAHNQPQETKKQAYAHAFGLYAVCAFYELTKDSTVLETANGLASLIDTQFWDCDKGGYIEALSADWSHGADQRLSDKDADLPKTMNTHLHVLEAYSEFYHICPTPESKARLERILALFLQRFISPDGRHVRLFYDMDWQDHSAAHSYGHDIESSWLIWEAALRLKDQALIDQARPVVLALAQSALGEGLNAKGAMSYEQPFGQARDDDGEWWGQAEALVGFINAYQMSHDKAYLNAAQRLWQHIEAEFKTKDKEWSWYAISASKSSPYIMGMWKCPYHNGRAMLELMRRLNDKS